jgi:hypothetical protein
VVLGLAVAACALAGWGVAAGEARAYQSFFTPLFGTMTQDPCTAQGVGPGGGLVVRRQPPLQENDVERSIALLCGPVYRQPFGTLLADDAIWQGVMGRSGGAPRHMLQGGQDSLPWKQGLSTKNHPAFKGPGGNALAWNDVVMSTEAWRHLTALIATLTGVPVVLPLAATFCIGGLAAIPVTAVPCAVGAAVIGALVLAVIVVPELIQLVGRYLQRNDAMNNGQWFAWSRAAGFFNGFGEVDQSWINPSLTSLADSAPMRVGVVFSNVLLNQGPDFDLSRVGAAETETPQSRRLGALVRRMERSHGLTRTGSRRGERLAGGRRDDYLFAAAGRDSIFGRRGNDVLLQGGRGNDRILGGPGNDNIDGHRGGDVLSGGPGNDQMVDFFGDTTVYTGRGRDLVAVRDGGGGDTVVCKGPGRKRILADRRDRIVGKVSGTARAVGARACPASSQVITDGLLPRLGRGY